MTSSYPPCRACGGQAAMSFRGGVKWIECEGCGARAAARATTEEAEASWQRLAGPRPPRAPRGIHDRIEDLWIKVKDQNGRYNREVVRVTGLRKRCDRLGSQYGDLRVRVEDLEQEVEDLRDLLFHVEPGGGEADE